MIRISTFFFSCILFLFLNSCEKDEIPKDIYCDIAYLEICNPTSDQIVVYGLNDYYYTDTLFPGECKIKEYESIHITYDEKGRIEEQSVSVIYFNTENETYRIGLKECYNKMNAPIGYINISHCYNGNFDPDKGELDTDCGGNCLPCKSFSLPCDSMQNNRLQWSDATGLLSLAYNYNQYWMSYRMNIQFTFYYGEEMNVSIPTEELPSSSQRFIIGSGFKESVVSFADRYGNNVRTAVEGQSIYFVVDNDGNQSIKFCDVDFENQFGKIYQASANLSVELE